MKMQIIRYPKVSGDFHLRRYGNEHIKRNAIAAVTGFSGKRENAIAQTVFGTSLKIQFYKLLKTTRKAIREYIARNQLGDTSLHVFRSESGQWQCHPEYIQETIQREKMRIYESRRE